MLWRHLCLARAWSALGLLTCSMLSAPALAEPDEPAPSAGVVTETVRILDARQSGDLALDVRGQGQDRVRIALRNTSAKRLNVILPPGLIAANASGQGARAGGGFQSMGIDAASNRSGGFGQFRASKTESGFQSVPPSDDRPASVVTVPSGQTVDLSVPGVCLNFGLPTPTSRDRFELMDVDDYTSNPRARKAFRTISIVGTSHGVAQAVMWNVFNGVPFDAMVAQAGRVINLREIELAARFVEALDASPDSDVLDPAYLLESRLFLEVHGEGSLAGDARRLAEALEGLHVLGLPVRLVDDRVIPEVSAPALHVKVVLTDTKAGETRGRIAVRQARRGEGWSTLGKTGFSEGSAASVLDGAGLARALDHAIASAFVSVKVARRGSSSTTLRVENRLPFTIANLKIRAGGSSGAPSVPFAGVGIGPARAALLPIEAASGTVDRVELDGL